MADDKITRRTTLTALGTAILGGCTTNQQNQTPNQTEPEPTNQTNNQENNEEQQNNTWNWNNVLQAEQEAKQFNANQRYPGLSSVVEGALEGENIGENLEDIDDNAYAYSHGGQTWDLQHFQNLDLTNETEFKQAVNDALTVAAHYMNTKEGDFASEWNNEMGDAAQIILEQAHDIDNLHIWPWSNDQHGFNYVLSEKHGVYTADGATPAIGRAGTNPLQGTYGNDIVSQFDESWIDPDSDIPAFQANIAQNFATNGMYEGVNEGNVGVHLPLLPEVFDKFQEEDSGEFLWNNYRPAIATSVYKREAEEFAEDEGIMINPESIENLPDLRQYENFQNYKTALRQHTEILVGEEAMGEVYLGEKQD